MEIWPTNSDMFDGGYRVVEQPVYSAPRDYDRSVASVVNRLRSVGGVRSVYQIGSVSTPGISDIDLVVVFDDGITYAENPLEGLDDQASYLFTHRLYGAPRSLFRKAQPYTFFHNYRLLAGDAAQEDSADSAGEARRTLRIQTALEYLLKMYVTSTIARVFRVVKLRSLFLHVNAVRYDLEFLGATDGRLAELTDRMVAHRSAWFDRPTPRAVLHDARLFFDELNVFLEEQLERYSFFLPGPAEYRIARSITLTPGRKLGYRHEGMVLPGVLSHMGRPYFSLQHRLNRFRFELPAKTRGHPESIAEHFEIARELTAYNRRHLPHFAPLTTSLNLP